MPSGRSRWYWTICCHRLVVVEKVRYRHFQKATQCSLVWSGWFGHVRCGMGLACQCPWRHSSGMLARWMSPSSEMEMTWSQRRDSFASQCSFFVRPRVAEMISMINWSCKCWSLGVHVCSMWRHPSSAASHHWRWGIQPLDR